MRPPPTHRQKPRPSETISINGKLKWRLDALCEVGRRSRTATIALLLDAYLSANTHLRDLVEEGATKRKLIQVKQTPTPDSSDAEVKGTQTP